MKWIFSIILFWLCFVVSLASWWLYFGITTLSKAAELTTTQYPLVRHQRMLFMEGSVLILFLVIGGVALFYFVFRMYKEKAVKEIFFASFTHDLKTSLFRLQLEVEKLSKQNLSGSTEPLMGQTRKLQLDLENALDSSIGHNKKIYIEKISLKEFMEDLHAQWPEFHIKFSGDDELRADKKAIQSIFKNLIHNSYVHGQADEVTVELRNKGNWHTLTYKDNGHSFTGNLASLGLVQNPSSGGSGFGLYIVKQWVERLGGKIEFANKKSLEILIELPRGG